MTGKVKGENWLAVEVDNSWDTTTLPGAKTRVAYQGDNMGFFFRGSIMVVLRGMCGWSAGRRCMCSG
ncbi:hypothetical protein ACQ86N_29245 [Puia sp. P3]|uniref:hypothetical protein n=1 Tax=Puia sp. P3 TaxID=3423952 RepID=UPI003D664F4B